MRGLSLQRFRDKVQLTTSPSAAAQVERFLGLAAATPLSRAALEALAIVAYQQPVTRPQIEAVRGVNSDSVIKNLLTKGLIEESGPRRRAGPAGAVLNNPGIHAAFRPGVPGGPAAALAAQPRRRRQPGTDPQGLGGVILLIGL